MRAVRVTQKFWTEAFEESAKRKQSTDHALAQRYKINSSILPHVCTQG